MTKAKKFAKSTEKMSENAENFFIPAEIMQEAQEAALRLLPAKSKSVYEKELVEFDNWRKKGA